MGTVKIRRTIKKDFVGDGKETNPFLPSSNVVRPSPTKFSVDWLNRTCAIYGSAFSLRPERHKLSGGTRRIDKGVDSNTGVFITHPLLSEAIHYPVCLFSGLNVWDFGVSRINSPINNYEGLLHRSRRNQGPCSRKLASQVIAIHDPIMHNYATAIATLRPRA